MIIIANNRQAISNCKQKFLSTLLLGGEIDEQLVSLFKKQYGDNVVRANVIYKCTKAGYISREGGHKRYTYALTDDGYNYLKGKCPNNYNYDVFKSNLTTAYSDSNKQRRVKLAKLLFELRKQNISCETHIENFRQIVDGTLEKPITVPYFITMREIKSTSAKFDTCIGTRCFGCIVTANQIIACYMPDSETKLRKQNEESLFYALKGVTYSCKWYNAEDQLSALYIYPNISEAVKSFEKSKADNLGVIPSTRSAYENSHFCNNFLYIINQRNYLREILDVTQIKRFKTSAAKLCEIGREKNEYVYRYKSQNIPVLFNLDGKELCKLFEIVKNKKMCVYIYHDEQSQIVNEITKEYNGKFLRITLSDEELSEIEK